MTLTFIITVLYKFLHIHFKSLVLNYQAKVTDMDRFNRMEWATKLAKVSNSPVKITPVPRPTFNLKTSSDIRPKSAEPIESDSESEVSKI